MVCCLLLRWPSGGGCTAPLRPRLCLVMRASDQALCPVRYARLANYPTLKTHLAARDDRARHGLMKRVSSALHGLPQSRVYGCP